MIRVAVVEAKASHKKPGDGLQQAKDYAQMLDLKFAYATNGESIVEFDFLKGTETVLDAFPSPDELWNRLKGPLGLKTEEQRQQFLTPPYPMPGKAMRYYQQITVDRSIREIIGGKKRVLLTMATGTGKTVVAFQICWKLWSSKWNVKGDPTRKPRILYLADRNFLVDDPKDKTFAPFGHARHKIAGGKIVHSRELYFSTYQAIAKDENHPGLYKEFACDFFDLVIVDECHRGSAKDESNWRDILEYFEPACQLGMTATPLRDDNRDTYLYFGNPIYTYSLRQGIDDGFLAPYRVHRIVTQWDAAGWRPSKGDLDRFGREIPDEIYTTTNFERRVARFHDNAKNASTDTHVAIARANQAIVDPDYLYSYLRGAQGQHQLRSRERGDWQREKISFRLTEQNLNDLRAVPILLPPPLAEQRRIRAELDALQAEVDALKKLQAATAAELYALLPSLLDRAFKGEL